MKKLYVLGVLLLALSAPLSAATYIVNTTTDALVGAGSVGSLRYVITQANANAGADIVQFNVPGAAPYQFFIATPLPDITGTLIIDGYTQPGSSANSLSIGNNASVVIVLKPSVGSTATRGLTFTSTANGSLVRGLVIDNFSNGGILLNGTSNTTIAGNWIGIDSDGSTAAGNGTAGLFALNGASSLIIGTSSPADRNVISGNSGSGILLGDSGTTGTIQNNYIGTNATGTAAVGNITGIQLISVTAMQIGGTGASQGNVISGNSAEGISVASDTGSATILGNLVGTNAPGNAALANGSGIYVYGSSGVAPANVAIGNDTSAGSNTIAYNSGVGIGLLATTPPATGVQVRGNSIFSNGGLGIDLGGDNAVTANDVGDGDSGGNGLQNFPLITSSSFSGGSITINGTFNSTANRNFTLRFYQNPTCDPSGNGEGQTYLGSTPVTTDGSGNATYSVTLTGPLVGVITATATDTTTNSTSEFSACSTVAAVVIPNITINDPVVTETNAGTTTLTYTVTLSAVSTMNVSVDYATANGTATAGSDYVTKSGTLTIPAGSTTGTIDVTVNGDVAIEPDETVLVNLTNPVNGVITDAQGVGTIQNDDALPTVTIADVTKAEGNGGGTTPFTFTVNFSGPATLAGSFNYATADGTAQGGSDFTSASGTVNFNAGDTSASVTINVAADSMNEVNETFFVNFSAPSNINLTDTQAIGTIQNDDAVPTVTISDASVSEGNAGSVNLNFTATLSNPSQPVVDVFFNTADGTATQPSDYASNSGSFSFPAGSTTTQVSVSVNGDTAIEANETFFVNLTGANNATVADDQAVGTIINDDGLGTPSITISDPTVTEGNAGTANLSYVVTLSSPSASSVSVNYQTADGSATAGSDYVNASGTLTIAPGNATGTIVVLVNADTTVEPNETVLLNLSAPSNATISDNQGIGTIVNDDVVTTTDVSITKTAAATVAPNANLTYTITVTNGGAVTATNVAVTDVLPAGTTFVSATPTQGSCSGTTTVSCNVGSVSASATASITLVVQVPASGTVVNTATVSSPEDSTPGNNSSTASSTVTSSIPTLSEWALIALILAIAAFATIRLR